MRPRQDREGLYSKGGYDPQPDYDNSDNETKNEKNNYPETNRNDYQVPRTDYMDSGDEKDDGVADTSATYRHGYQEPLADYQDSEDEEHGWRGTHIAGRHDRFQEPSADYEDSEDDEHAINVGPIGSQLGTSGLRHSVVTRPAPSDDPEIEGPSRMRLRRNMDAIHQERLLRRASDTSKQQQHQPSQELRRRLHRVGLLTDMLSPMEEESASAVDAGHTNLAYTAADADMESPAEHPKKSRRQVWCKDSEQDRHGYDTRSKLDSQRNKRWKKMSKAYQETFSDWRVWKGAFKEIEGHFGSAVVSYFRFLKWLFWLNLFLAVLLLAVIMLPQMLMQPWSFQDTIINSTYLSEIPNLQRSFNHTKLYDDYLDNYVASQPTGMEVVDFVQGTGWMERTVLFYGFYFNKTYHGGNSEMENYNMPLGYLLAILIYFVLSLLAMVHYTAHGVKESLGTQAEKFYQACNKVFCGWDYNLVDDKGAELTHKRLAREYTDDFEEKCRLKNRKAMSTLKTVGLMFLRLVINTVVLAVLVGCGMLIVFTTMQTEELAQTDTVRNNAAYSLLLQFLPSITITGLNIIAPIFFNYIVLWEKYMPDTELKLTIFRTVLLRLASVGVLVITLQSQVGKCSADAFQDHCVINSNLIMCCCWETYVGQQFYKLVLLDFIVVLGVTFLVDFPRKLIVNKWGDHYAMVQRVGEQEFEIPANVLSLVYSQTLCWMGAVFSPLIPAMTVAKFMIYFYVKKFTLLHNCVPSSRPYRASRSNSFFLTVLLISFVLCSAPVVYTITKIRPSQSCGPFRIHSGDAYVMWSALTDATKNWPPLLQTALTFVNSWMVYVPLAVVLGLIIYYYTAVSSGYRRKIEQQKLRLASEAQDKQFLLNQVRLRLLHAGTG